jgi:hypothetical protein
MSSLKNFASDESIANETDRVGGGGGGVLESGVYPVEIKLAYVTKSEGGATGVVFQGETEHGRTVRETLWISSGTAKGCKNYYEKDGQKHYLPGFLIANSIALLAAGTELSDLDTETKVVGVYNSEAKAEVPTKVEMITGLIGKNVILGVLKVTEDKNVKDASGNYVPSGETRDTNTIDKVFRASDRKTTQEIRTGVETAAFIDTWLTANEGKVRNKAKGAAAGGTAGAPKAAAGAAAGSAKPKTSLFASS